ncbi:MAG: glycosyltransferase [bacterium]
MGMTRSTEMTGDAQRIYAVLHRPGHFASRSAFPPLVEILGATPVYYDIGWEKLQRRSWRLGHALRAFGNRYYGSEWNALIPFYDEGRLARQIKDPDGCLVHFLYGEFATPRSRGLFRGRTGRLVGTFHASVRKQPSVLGRSTAFRNYDWISVVSATQVPFFIEHGFPVERIRVLPLGVDTDYFAPPDSAPPVHDGPLRGLLVGTTERDHEFMASVMKRMPPGVLELSVRTVPEQESNYRGVSGVNLLPRLSDDELVRAYGSAELLVMPLLDCTANDAILEAMACGTPVVTNRVGGIPEYVSGEAGYLLDEKRVDLWVDQLAALARKRDELRAMRPAVRRWAERFSWRLIASQYRQFYRDALAT